MEFDEFVKIPVSSTAVLSPSLTDICLNLQGCTKGTHSATAAAPSIAPSPNATTPTPGSVAVSQNGVETYGSASASTAPSGTATPTAAAPSKPAVPEKIDWAAKEDHDSADAKIPKGSRCKRRGCGAEWDGEDGGARSATEGWKRSQSGEGDACGECRYHPGNVR